VKVSETNKYPASKLRRDPDSLHHYLKGEIRILSPAEYTRLRNAIPQDRHKVLLDILIITGMRYIEAQRLHENKSWYIEKENIIHLPQEAQQKHKRSQLERTIYPLPGMFSYIMKEFFAGIQPPCESVWNRDLRRWATDAGINPYGISAKTTRKSLESWLIKAGMLESSVCLRQGHDSLTSMRHYQGIAFSDNDIRDIKKQLTEWNIVKT
jgi:integrase